jgi:cytochrome c oxidase subunit IV
MQSHIVSVSTYLKVAACLGVLLVLTVLAADYNLGYLNTPIALAIALLKAVLIVLFFMNVRNGSPLLRIFAVGGFVWLAIMFIFVLADVVARS